MVFNQGKKTPLHSGSDTRVGCLVLSFSVCMSVYVCVIQHCFCPPLTTALDAHATKSSPRGICECTHTQDTFSSWWDGKWFPVGRARCGNVCRHMSVLGRVQNTKSNQGVTVFLCLPTAAGRLCLPTVHSMHTYLLCLPTARRLCASPQRADWACPQLADWAYPQQAD